MGAVGHGEPFSAPAPKPWLHILPTVVYKKWISIIELILEIWAEFTGRGKEEATLADLMRHELGKHSYTTFKILNFRKLLDTCLITWSNFFE